MLSGRLGLTRYGFAGLDIPERAQACLTRFARVTDTQSAAADVRTQAAATLGRTQICSRPLTASSRAPNREQIPAVYTFPADLEVGRQLLMAAA